MKLPRFTLRDLFWLVLVAALGFALLHYMPVARWDGAYALTIQPKSQSNRLIAAVYYLDVPRPDYAQFVIGEGWPQEGFKECTRDNGFVAYMPTYGQANALGFNLSRGEWKHLVICAEYSDGTHSMALVVAPNGGSARTVSVVVP